MARLLAALAMLASAAAFVPGARMAAPRAGAMRMQGSVFDSATSKFAADFPEFYARGWGPTTKAERWNGRHAMFGWFAIVLTGYMKSHGLLPTGAVDPKAWGDLAYLTGGVTPISLERAAIMAAHMHALFISAAATIAPLSFQDKLLLDKGEEAEPAAGVFIPFEPGLTAANELMHGRFAMLGLVALLTTSVSTNTPILDVVNTWLGGLLLG